MTSRPQRPNLPASVKIMAFKKSSSNASVRRMQSQTGQVADATNSRSTQFQPIPHSQLTSTTEKSINASDVAKVKKSENIPMQNFGPGKSATQPQSQRFKDTIVQPGQSVSSAPQGQTKKEYNKVQIFDQHGQNLNSPPQSQVRKEYKQNQYGQSASSIPRPTSRECRVQNAIHHGPSVNSSNQGLIKKDNTVQSSGHHGRTTTTQGQNLTTQGQTNEYRPPVYKKNP